ncbi:MAG: hypothetical protein HND47_10895 [Chloroflexi bacterium]|nr:hypothetical protein [Chloroflexota bacterium]
MRNRNTNIILRGVSILFLTAALVLAITSLITYSRQRNNYPAGMTIAGVPVGGLSPVEASQRLLEVYTSPIEARYEEARIHIDPGTVGFQIDIETMLAAADLSRTGGSFWGGFWDYIWNRTPPETQIPLSASISEDRLREYLQNEIASRYDEPPAPAQPVPGGTSFLPGARGGLSTLSAPSCSSPMRCARPPTVRWRYPSRAVPPPVRRLTTWKSSLSKSSSPRISTG